MVIVRRIVMCKKSIRTVICLVLVSTILGITSIVYAADNINTETTQSYSIYIDTTNSPCDYSKLCCHIKGKDGEMCTFGSKKECCEYVGNNIWKYDPFDISYGNDYLIYFYDYNTYKTTNELLLDSTCLGDTVYFNGTMTEYQSPKILWKNHDNSKYASILKITSSGEVIGNYCLNYQNPYNMFISFLKYDYTTAIANSDKNEQEFINNIGYKLGLSGVEVERAIIYSGKNIKWYREYYIEPTTPLPSESIIPTSTETQSNRILGDIDGDGEVTIVDSTCIQRHLAQVAVYVEGIGEPIK